MNDPRFFSFWLALATILALSSSLLYAHFDHREPRQSYRQSVFALIALNFGPIAAMAKGDMDWDDKKLTVYANELDQVVNLKLINGFTPDSKKGKTRARPEIWKNLDDFEVKLAELRSATKDLKIAAKSTDKAQIIAAIGATGKSCKNCHDNYKTKDYIY